MGKALQADYHLIASTSKGVVPQRFFCHCLGCACCVDCAQTTANLYPRALANDSSCSSTTSWVPDAIVVLLGYNWFMLGCMPTVPQLQKGYMNLFAEIRSVQETSHIVCVALDWETMPGGASLLQHQEVAERVNTAVL